MRKIVLLFAWVCGTLCAALAQSYVPYSHPNLRYVGRCCTPHNEYLRYSYPGFQIHALFQGTSVKFKMKPNSGYYMVELDNREPYKVHCPESDSVLTIAQNLAPSTHRLTVTFATEGLKHLPQFHGMILDEGCTLPQAPQLPTRKIEFIGNSITCGFGIEGTHGKEKFRYDTQNQFYTYAAIASRRLQAQCFVVARSGIGVYRNCGGKVLGDKGIMPDVYPYTLFGTTGQLWDFSRYTPQVVCVNLGTNDTTNPGYRTELLYKGYKRFYNTLRSHYPQAKIVLLTGSMLRAGSQRLTDLCAVIERIKQEAAQAGDKEVYSLNFTPEDGSLGYGSAYHPSMARQAKMADELTDFLKNIMGWDVLPKQ